MSSPDRFRRAALALAVLAPVSVLGGCFRPEYAADTPGVPGVGDALKAVQIDTIDGRVGQQVRNNLSFAFTGGGEALPARYVLHATVKSSTTDVIVDVPTNLPEVDTVAVVAEFTLTPVGSDKPVLDGKNFARKSFDRSLQRFAAVRAQRDAENLAAATLADEIKTRVAGYFAAHS